MPSPPPVSRTESRLRLLHMVSLSLLAGEDTRTIAQRALADLSGVVTGAARLTFWTLNAADEFVAESSASRGALQSIEGLRIPMGANLPWLHTLQSGQTILVTDVDNDSRVGAFRDAFQRAGTGALAVTPITSGGALLGGISVAANQPRTWVGEEVETLHALADALAIGIARDRSERQRAQAAAELRRREAHQRIVGATATFIAQAKPTIDVAREAFDAILQVIPDVRLTCWLGRGAEYAPACSVSGTRVPPLRNNRFSARE